MIWLLLHPRMTPDYLGFVPSFLDENDPRSAREQLDANYRHGGGWRPFGGDKFKLTRSNCLEYPGDPALQPRAQTMLREELVIAYDHAIVAIVQPDRSFEVARLD